MNGERYYLKHVLETDPYILFDSVGVSTVEGATAIVELLDDIGFDDLCNVSPDFKKAIETLHSSYRVTKKHYSALNDAEFKVFRSRYESKMKNPNRCPLSNLVLTEIEKEREEASKNPLSELLAS